MYVFWLICDRWIKAALGVYYKEEDLINKLIAIRRKMED